MSDLSFHPGMPEERPYLPLFLFVCLVAIVLVVAGFLRAEPAPGTFIMPRDNGEPELHTIISETISIVGVATGIVVAGAGVFAPLFISIWIAASDRMYQLYVELTRAIGDAEHDGVRKKLVEGLAETAKAIETLNGWLPTVKYLFRGSLILSLFLIALLATVVIFPREDYAYTVAVISVYFALAIGFLFIGLVLLLQFVSPATTQRNANRCLMQYHRSKIQRLLSETRPKS